MKGMDRAAQLAMMPDYEIFCVDLTEGSFLSTLSYWYGVIAVFSLQNWMVTTSLNFIILICTRQLSEAFKIPLYQGNYTINLRWKLTMMEIGCLKRQTLGLFLNLSIIWMWRLLHTLLLWPVMVHIKET